MEKRESERRKTVITLSTNFNNKLGCEVFLHISFAPPSPLPESHIKNTLIEIRTADESFPPVTVELIDICRVPLGNIHSMASLASHAMDYHEFYNWFCDQYPLAGCNTPVAVYYYKKIIP